MPDPLSWEIRFSDLVVQSRENYTRDLVRKVYVAGLRRSNNRAVEHACYQQDAFSDFLRDLRNYTYDPAKLPPAVDENDVVIPDCYVFDDDPWTAYLLRTVETDATSHEEKGITTVSLLFDEKDRPTALAAHSLSRR